jgi:hypothetical protein
MVKRELAVWSARHDNGWETYALENHDGTYAAWAAPVAVAASVDYIEMDAENAKRAALFALRTKSGHDACSERCSGWELHSHPVDPG